VLARIGISPVPWLTDPNTAMPAIAAMVTWKKVGFYVIIYLAGPSVHPTLVQGRQSRSKEQQPGSDFGSSRCRCFFRRRFSWSHSRRSTASSSFIEPYVMTGGGPLRRTYSIVLYLYTNAFAYQKMGYAATIGVALALIIGSVVFIQRRVNRQG
jgi:ABC-type sugar transport system permease subunit